MRRIGLLLLLLVLTAATTAGAEGDNWYTYEEGMLAAGANNKPILIDFYADWCPPCVAMEEGTYPDSRVVSEMSDFIGIKVDTQKRIDIEKKYLIEYYPTIVFLNSKGEEISRHIGYLNPEGMVEEIRKVRDINNNDVEEAPDINNNDTAETLDINNNDIAEAPDINNNDIAETLDINNNDIAKAPDINNNDIAEAPDINNNDIAKAPDINNNDIAEAPATGIISLLSVLSLVFLLSRRK